MYTVSSTYEILFRALYICIYIISNPHKNLRNFIAFTLILHVEAESQWFWSLLKFKWSLIGRTGTPLGSDCSPSYFYLVSDFILVLII